MSLWKRLFGKKEPEPTEEDVIEFENTLEHNIRINRIKRKLKSREDGFLDDENVYQGKEAEEKLHEYDGMVEVLPTYYEYDDEGNPTGETRNETTL